VSAVATPSTPLAKGGVSRAQAWLLALRLRTLPVGAAPVLLGSAAAYGAGRFRLGPALAALAGALLLQVGANLANDLFDGVNGLDGPSRKGPVRAVGGGLLSATAVAGASAAAFLVAMLVGIYLVAEGGAPIAITGLLGIAAGVAYTGGPRPLGYMGLGDPLVFAFFGLAAVVGTYHVQAGPAPAAVWWAGAALGAHATAVLAINNLRDRETDGPLGKRTLAVRLGDAWTRRYTIALLLAPFAVAIALASEARDLAPLLALPLALSLARTVALRSDGPALNDALAGTARLLLVFAALWMPRFLRGDLT